MAAKELRWHRQRSCGNDNEGVTAVVTNEPRWRQTGAIAVVLGARSCSDGSTTTAPAKELQQRQQISSSGASEGAVVPAATDLELWRRATEGTAAAPARAPRWH